MSGETQQDTAAQPNTQLAAIAGQAQEPQPMVQPPAPVQNVVNLAASELAGKGGLHAILSEASKYAVLAVFVLYSIGFLIWHSYLANFCVSSVGFLQAEYFSAALCYLIMLAPFTLPSGLLFERLLDPEKKSKAATISVTMVILVSMGLIQTFSTVFFPESTYKFSNKGYILLAGLLLIMILYMGAQVVCRFRESTSAFARFVNKWDIGLLCLVLLGLSLVLTNPELSKFFVVSAILLYPGIFYSFGGKAKLIWINAGPIIRIMLITFTVLLLVSNIVAFGSGQFGYVARRLGGGRPELAYLKFSPQHADLVASLKIPAVTNVDLLSGFVGPITVLLRTEKEIIFLNNLELSTPEYTTNETVTVTTNLATAFTTNVLSTVITNKDSTLQTNTTTSIIPVHYSTNEVKTARVGVKNPVRLTAKQVRSELVEAIVFGKDRN